tara:strand:- start:29 stop:406 length:378 start_codon:yes stop_codon:yes gene_type:complete
VTQQGWLIIAVSNRDSRFHKADHLFLRKNHKQVEADLRVLELVAIGHRRCLKAMEDHKHMQDMECLLRWGYVRSLYLQRLLHSMLTSKKESCRQEQDLGKMSDTKVHTSLALPTWKPLIKLASVR